MAEALGSAASKRRDVLTSTAVREQRRAWWRVIWRAVAMPDDGHGILSCERRDGRAITIFRAGRKFGGKKPVPTCQHVIIAMKSRAWRMKITSQ